MTTIERRDFVRGTFATSVLGLATAAVGLPSHAAAAVPLVRRDTVIERAWFWVNRNVQYSQSATYPGPGGQARYRTDCSGFVSMCLMLPPPGPNTTGLAGSTWSVGIRKVDLRRGDYLVDAGNHCVLFAYWIDKAAGKFMMFEMSNPASDMNRRAAYLSSYSGYQARRARNIRD